MRRVIFAFACVCGGSPLFAQSLPLPSSALWNEVDEGAMVGAAATMNAPSVAARRNIVPQSYRTLELNRTALAKVLAAAPAEFSGPIDVASVEVTIPLPEGGFGRFHVQESAVMEPKLAAKFPEIKTYVGQGIDDPAATMRMDVTPAGFHAMILSPRGQSYIDPYWRDSDGTYVAYRKSDYVVDKPFSCLVDSVAGEAQRSADRETSYRPTGATLKSYRLALACTGEYAAAVCSPNAPTKAATLAAMVTSVNRVSGIYERDFAIRFLLVANTDLLVYLDSSTDPYSNGDGVAMLGQNQTNITNVIGSANYDFGHVFSTGGGGVASLGVICAAGSKARGVTGTGNPKGDPYDVDFVAHEMGHQFNGNHTFNSTVASCNGNRNPGTAYEVGSGSTIMAYAGICTSSTVVTDLAPNSDNYFHSASYTEIDDFTSNLGAGGSCPVNTATGNSPPVVTAPGPFTIPANTPFALTGSATDSNGDTVTYCWEEFDLGAAQATQNPSSSSNSPLFRSLPPTVNPTRFFPSLTYILNNANTPPGLNSDGYATGEVLPTVNRTMEFRVTARDNRAGGGGSNWAPTSVTTVATGSAFLVTAPNTSVTFPGGTAQTVTWNVAGTTGSGINCTNVKISLSTDGGNTFPIVLVSATPNDGSESIAIPQIATTQGRIKVEAMGNIFFDISNANFTVTSTNAAPTLNVTGDLTVARGKPTPTVANVATVADANGDTLSVSVSNAPFGATISPTIVSGSISFSGVVDCSVVTTLTSRTYPVTVTVTDSNGASTSGTVNLVVTPNPSPTLGAYPNVAVSPGNTVTSTPSSPAADSNGNLPAAPYSIMPTTLPGGGTISINQTTGVVTASTTAGSTLATTTVRVTVLDSCGTAAVSFFNVNVLSPNPVLQPATASAPTTESCAPGNGVADPGETVTVQLPINNVGGSGTTNIVATLQNSGGLTPITTSQNYGAISSNGSATRPFQFTVNAACGAVVTATLQLQDGATNYGTITFPIRLGVLTPSPSLFQNFDGVAAGTLPPGWAVSVTGAMAPWNTNTTSPDSAPNSVSASTVVTASDNRLTSASVAIPNAAPQISFRHRWNLETGYDGGILEISIPTVNGGAFAEIIAAGGSFVSGGYNGAISEEDGSAIAGANAWTGNANGSYTTTLVNLPPAAAGQNVQFRWRLVTDAGVSPGSAVWRVDTINIISNSYVCSPCTPAQNYFAGYGLSGGNAAFDFDFEGDGIENGLEYALNLNPTVSSQAGLPVVVQKDYAGTEYLSMTFIRYSDRTDLTYIVQGSSNLSDWTSLAMSAGGAAMSGPGFVSETGPAPAFAVEVRDTEPMNPASTPRFLRLKVTSP